MPAMSKAERGRRQELYAKVYELVREFGAWSLDCMQLSKSWDVPHKTVWNWKVKAENEIGAVDIKSVGKSVKNQMEANLRLAHNAVRKAANKVSKKDNPTGDDIKTFGLMLKAYNDTVSKHTEFAERWGYKSIVAQKLEMTHETEAERLARVVSEMDVKAGEMEEVGGEDFT